MFFLLLFIVITLFSVILTGGLRRYAISRSLLDIPNPRSSHSIPTPRGGGVAIVIAFLAGLTVLAVVGNLPVFLYLALLGGGAGIALIGWLDDIKDIPARLRLPVHFIVAGWALAWLGGLPSLSVLGIWLDMGMFGNALAVVYLVWLLNLYNFMDGIDGIAGIEAVTVCLGAAVLYMLSPAGDTFWMMPILLIGAAMGFLYWNFPRARIFMGDAGSGFLGLMLGVLSIHAAWISPALFWGWVILLGAFVVDATVTLLLRAWRGKKVSEAHRDHAYQHAARRYNAHIPVALAFGGINLFWLLPIAALVVMCLLDGVMGIVVAYLPLVCAAFWFEAGEEA